MNNISQFENKAWCGNCGEYKPKLPRCPDCGRMVRLWPKPCRSKSKWFALIVKQRQINLLVSLDISLAINSLVEYVKNVGIIN